MSQMIVAELNDKMHDQPSVDGPLQERLASFEEDDDVSFEVQKTYTVSNHPDGEPSRSYLVQELVVEVPDATEVWRVLGCTCPSMAYNNLPAYEDVRSPLDLVRGATGCKHCDKVLERARNFATRPEGQRGMDDYGAEQ